MYGFIGPAIHGNVDRGDTILKAFISLCLTLSNILCIIIFGAVTFYIKELAPIPGKTAFWDDVKTVRHRFDISQKTVFYYFIFHYYLLILFIDQSKY